MRRIGAGGWRLAAGSKELAAAIVFCLAFALPVFRIPNPESPIPRPAPLGLSEAVAHHSLAGMYDSSKRITLDGTIAAFHFVNPHPYVLIDVTDDRGRTQQWHAEMDNRRELIDIGMKADTLAVGDRVVASGSPGIREARILYAWKLERPADGLLYEQIGASPRIKLPR